MNKEKLEKLKKSLDNKFIPDNMKEKIRAEIKKLETEIKTDETITATEVKEEVKEIEKKVEKALEVAEEKEEKEEKAEKKETEKAIKKTAMAVAKTIRKDGEKWSEARKRANDVMKKEKVDAEKTTKSELDRLLARVRKNKSLMAELEGVKDLGRDASRHAKPVGKRVSANGNVYYEYRPNKTDRKTYGKYAFAEGGDVEKPKELKGYFVHILKSPYDSKMNVVPTTEKIILVTDGKKGDSFSVMSNEPHLKLVERTLFGKKYIHAEPVNFEGTTFKQKMFGGNFVWSTDSRFRDDVSELPIPLHDRIEYYEKGGKLKKSGRYSILGEVEGEQPILYTTTDDKERIKPLVNMAEIDLYELTGKNHRIFVTDEFTDDEVYHYEKGGGLETPYNVVYLTKSGRGMVAKNIMAKNEEEAKEKLEKQMRASTSFDKVVMVHESFELGGSVVTDLAGHQDGIFGVGNHGVLDGFSGTNYTGLVGETGAMSSGELFMDGGAVGMVNQQVIDNASQSYVNYYLGEGASAGIFKDGGAIENQYEGKTPAEVWSLWTEKQKQHFLIDHFNYFSVEEFKGKNLIEISRLEYKELPKLVRLELDYHVNKGQYAKGGNLIGNQKNIDLNHNGKIDAEDFKLLRSSMNGAWRNERNHVNHSENHEVRYARKNTNRTGYKGKRNFEVGGEFMTDPNFGNFQNNIYADGGMIGKEVTFIRHGESGKGIIGGINDDGSFAVATKHSIKLVEPDDILEIHDAPKKSRWFFDKGGYTNETDNVNHNEDYEVRYVIKKENRTGYKGKRSFDDGGDIPLMFLIKKEDVVIAEFKTEEEAKDFIYEYELEHPRVNLELINPNFIPKFSKKYVPENRLSESEWMMKHNSSREARAYAGGGKVSFAEKSKAIAKKFEGKRVEPKYQKEYGKVYDKDEAKEVGNKIAGSQKAKYDAKAEKGAVVKKNRGNHKMKATTDLARKIRRDGEKWTDAIKRASQQIKNN